jgi:hypothetical protein
MVMATNQTVFFKWNTTGFAYGNYTIAAYAEPLPEETDISDNNFTCAVPVHVGALGDISSSTPGVYDNKCDMKDIAIAVAYFNQHE